VRKRLALKVIRQEAAAILRVPHMLLVWCDRTPGGPRPSTFRRALRRLYGDKVPATWFEL
jgi:hypothetical protein